VEIVEVQVVGLKTPEALLTRGQDVLARSAEEVRPVCHRHAGLGGEDDLLARHLP
jgi:hypothetical protein